MGFICRKKAAAARERWFPKPTSENEIKGMKVRMKEDIDLSDHLEAELEKLKAKSEPVKDKLKVSQKRDTSKQKPKEGENGNKDGKGHKVRE